MGSYQASVSVIKRFREPHTPNAGAHDQIVLYFRPIERNTKPITPNTDTMFQWITRPIAMFATTATASTTNTAIAANATDRAQLRFSSACALDLEDDFGPVPDFLFALDFASVSLRRSGIDWARQVPDAFSVR